MKKKIKWILDTVLPYKKRRQVIKYLPSQRRKFNNNWDKVFKNFDNPYNHNISLIQKFSLFRTLNSLETKSKLPKTSSSIVTHSFLNFNISAHNYATLNYLINEIFIRNEYFYYPKKANPIIFDCGANIGISCLYFKKNIPECKIIAFEPNPHAFELLKRNLLENNINDIDVINVALHSEKKEIPFFMKENFANLRASTRSERGGKTEFIVQTEKLSDYLKKFEMVDLVKMDVEGSEIDILKDLIQTSTIQIPNEYFIEYHHNIDQDKSALSSFLKPFEDNGFTYNMRGVFRSGSRFQDLFIHFYKE